MSISKALQLVQNNITKKINKLIQNNFFMDIEDGDDKFSFNHSIVNYIIFEKNTKKNNYPYYFTLENLCDDLYLCVWFKQSHINRRPNHLYSKYYTYVRELMEEIEEAKHSVECEGNYEDECNCDVDYQYHNYNNIRQNYSLQYYKKIEIQIKKDDNDDKNYDIKLNGLFEFIINFNFDECINCNKLCDDLCSSSVLKKTAQVSEDLCDNCLLKIDENHKEHNDECPICYDNECLKFKIKTPCNHIFHKECLLNCRKTRMIEHNKNENECPYCRKGLDCSFFHNL